TASPLPHQETRPTTRVSLGAIIAISIFWFALNYHWGALQILLIPDQVTSLLLREAPGATLADQAAWANSNTPLTLALVVAPGLIVALISNPLFGLLSDRTRSRFGRRMPYIVVGTLLNIGALLLMAYAPGLGVVGHSGNTLAPSLLILMGALMLTQLTSNAAQAPFHALLPDIVPEAQRGLASGIMGFAQLFGTIGGVLGTSLLGMNSQQLLHGTQSPGDFDARIKLGYIITGAVIGVIALITALTARERAARIEAGSLIEGRTIGQLGITVSVVVVAIAALIGAFRFVPALGLTQDSFAVIQLVALVIAGIGAARAFEFRPRRNTDFTWVVVTRMLVQLGIYTVLTFLTPYMREAVHAPNPESAASNFIIVVSVTAIIPTVLVGWLSDRFGRKRMVYISGAFMAAVGAVFIFAPYVISGDIVPIILGAAAIFGLGYGAYVAVDWALVADVLPSDATFARDMGVWNIGLTLAQVLAAVVGGWLLAFGRGVGGAQLAYALLFLGFVVFSVAGTVTVRYIRGVKK
ncbi:MAG TPA: MFS transporter, partial [Ktedonobacterales bacterium]